MLEFEQLLQLFFAEQGTKSDARATVAATLAWARERNVENLAVAREYLDGTGPFPERSAHTVLVGGFLTEYYAMVARWARWAAEQVERWPDDPARAVLDREVLRAVVRRAEW